MPENSPDKILFEKIRNYCKDPWVSTRVRLPEYGVPVLIAYHCERTTDKAKLDGFSGFTIAIGARFKYTEEYVIEKDSSGKDVKRKITKCHYGSGLTLDDLYLIDKAYGGAGSIGSNWYTVCTYEDKSYLDRGTSRYGLRTPYLNKKEKSNSENKLQSFDYWVDFSNGKFGKVFSNIHAADRSFIPQSTIDTLLENQKKNHGRRFDVLQLSPDSDMCRQPDFWMPIPALR